MSEGSIADTRGNASGGENYEQDFENDSPQYSKNEPTHSTIVEGRKSAMDILRESGDEIVAEERSHAEEVLRETVQGIDRELINPRRTDNNLNCDEDDDDGAREKPSQVNRSNSQDSVSEQKDSDDESLVEDGDPELNKGFMIACWRGETRKVDSLLRDGASYLARDRHGWTGLMWAASKGFDDIVENLVERTENKKMRLKYLNAKDGITGWTPLHIACIKGQVKCIRLLVKLGANVDTQNFLNETPVECLQCENSDDRMEIRHFLNERSSKKKKDHVEGKDAD